MLGICVGTGAGAGLLSIDTTGRATLALGLALMLYAVIGLAAVRLRIPDRAEPWLSPLVGAATGLVTAATGVLVIPAVPYLQALALEKRSEEHTSELQSLMRISYAVFCLIKKQTNQNTNH